MKLVVDMDKECFINAIKYDDVKEAIEFYLSQEFEKVMNVNDFLEINKNNSVIEICDSIEFDVDEDFARLLDRYRIPYSMFVLIEEDNERDDTNSVNFAKNIFSDLDIYSEYQGMWV